MPGLENYLALLGRVDALCARTVEEFASHLSCRAGCDACCRHLTVFAVEAEALREALLKASGEVAARAREGAANAGPDAPCPLLHDGLCLLYEARPIICRTHGLPLLLKREGATAIDFCPENFKDVTCIPGSAVIDLDRLNAVLATINSLFLQAFPGPERVTIADAIGRRD